MFDMSELDLAPTSLWIRMYLPSGSALHRALPPAAALRVAESPWAALLESRSVTLGLWPHVPERITDKYRQESQDVQLQKSKRFVCLFASQTRLSSAN